MEAAFQSLEKQSLPKELLDDSPNMSYDCTCLNFWEFCNCLQQRHTWFLTVTGDVKQEVGFVYI